MSTTTSQKTFPIEPSWDSSLGLVWSDHGLYPDQFAERLGMKYHKVGTFKSHDDKKLQRVYFNEDMKEIAQYQYNTQFFVVLHTPRTWDLAYYKNSFDWS